MALRNYSSTSPPRTTGSSLGSVAGGTVNTVQLSTASNLPPTPFTACLERSSASEELVLVTDVTGTTATVTRGYDGTASPAHSSGVPVEHCVGGLDYREANAHVNATSGAHGVSGSLVGTTDTQTLTAKTLVAPYGLANSVDAAVTLRGYAADPAIPLILGTTESGSAVLFSVGSSGTVTANASALQPSTDRVVEIVKAKSGQASDLTQWQSSAAAVLAKVDVAAALLTSGNVSAGSTTALANTRLSVQTGATSRAGVTVRGVASQTADLVALQDSGGNPLAASGSDGTAYAPGYGHTSKTGPRLAPSATGFLIGSTAVGDVPLALRRVSGQTGDLLQVQNESAVAVGRVDGAGATWLASRSRAGLDNANSSGSFSISAAAVGEVPLTLYGNDSGQTAALMTVYDKVTSGAEIAGITSAGVPYADAVKLGVKTAAGTALTAVGSPTSDATTYPFGTSVRDATIANGFPDTGPLLTHRYTSRAVQFLYGLDHTYYRRAATNTWQPWRGGNMSGGVLKYAEVLANESINGAGPSAVPGLAVSFTLDETRAVKVTVQAQVSGSVTGDKAMVWLANTAGTQVSTGGILTIGADALPTRLTYYKVLATGSYTYTVYKTRTSGTGTLNVHGATGDPSFILAEDLGLPPP